jgi:sugar fermentation stimulation protein A
VGRLGSITFESGIYFYVGSGGRSPLKRLRRHVAKAKKKFWHIDFLTVHSKVVGAIIMESRVSLECRLAQALADVFTSVDGFGSSDCRCPSHLFFAGSAPRCGSPSSSIRFA